jgi:DNA-binding transcriptional LysR family regulator
MDEELQSKNLVDIYHFCLVIEHGGFTRASMENKVSAATLSRSVSKLEEKLGVKLLHRSPKVLELTSQGELFFRKYYYLVERFREVWDELGADCKGLTGDIYISCPEPFADFYLQDLALRFMKENPDVGIHVVFSSNTQHYLEDHIDLAIVTTPSTIPALVQKKLFTTELSMAASPNYLKEFGCPISHKDLKNHCVLAGNSMPYWELEKNGQSFKIAVNSRYSIDSLRLVTKAAKKNMGICLIPSSSLVQYAAREELKPVLTDYRCAPGVGYLVWNDRKLVPKSVVAFRELILEELSDSEAFLVSVTENKHD